MQPVQLRLTQLPIQARKELNLLADGQRLAEALGRAEGALEQAGSSNDNKVGQRRSSTAQQGQRMNSSRRTADEQQMHSR